MEYNRISINSTLYYLPRAIGVLGILFISIFAFDVFEAGTPLPEMLLGLFMHLVPSFVLTVLLVLAWKFELLGGVLFVLISLVPFLFLPNEWWVNGILALPFFITGLLFVVHYWRTVELPHFTS